MTYHTPVLLHECIEGLHLQAGKVYVDTTLGGGGHSEAILQAEPSIRLFSFDQDADAIRFASERLQKYEDRFTAFHANFSELRTRLALSKIKKVDGVLFDLGISSFQVDEASKGFSFSHEGLLDMRMDQRNTLTAADVVNTFSVEELSGIFKEFGEERDSVRIARKIVEQRSVKPIQTTSELSFIIEKTVGGAPMQQTKAKARIFQALRIYVNSELERLEETLKDCINILNKGGRMVVITFHSLEDRIVKNFFKQEAIGCTCPSNVPHCICGKKPRLMLINRKPIVASETEVLSNTRARSAKLRVAERI